MKTHLLELKNTPGWGPCHMLYARLRSVNWSRLLMDIHFLLLFYFLTSCRNCVIFHIRCFKWNEWRIILLFHKFASFSFNSETLLNLIKTNWWFAIFDNTSQESLMTDKVTMSVTKIVQNYKCWRKARTLDHFTAERKRNTIMNTN